MNMEKESKTKYIVAMLAAIVVLGGGAFYYLSNKSVSSDNVAPIAKTAATSEPQNGTSLKDLLAKTEPTKCTVTTSSDLSDSSGIVYISNGKMRSDFSNTMKSGPLSGKVQVAHMIVDTEISYMWGEGMMKNGIKMAKKDMLDVKPQEGNSPQNQAAIDMNEKSDYKCKGWKADTAMFIPPSDIEFQDMGAMIKSMPRMETPSTNGSGIGAAAVPTGMTAEQLAQMCGACDSAGDGKVQCRAALGCK